MVDQNRIRDRHREVFVVAPNDLHHPLLTRLYKRTTGPLKRMPFLVVLPLVFVGVVVVYILFGHVLIGLAGLLQYGS